MSSDMMSLIINYSVCILPRYEPILNPLGPTRTREILRHARLFFTTRGSMNWGVKVHVYWRLNFSNDRLRKKLDLPRCFYDVCSISSAALIVVKFGTMPGKAKLIHACISSLAFLGIVYGAFTAGKYGPLHAGSTRYGFVLNVKATLRSVSQEEMMVVTVSDSGISSRHFLDNYIIVMHVCISCKSSEH